MSSREAADGIKQPSPLIPPADEPAKATIPKRVAMKRPKLATTGRPIQLVTNHFEVTRMNFNDYFYHYMVNMKYEDDHPIGSKGIGRKVIDKLYQTYRTSLGDKDFAYDGEKSLFTLDLLPYTTDEFVVPLENSSANKMTTQWDVNKKGNDSPSEGDRKRMRRPYQTKTIKVELKFVAKIPMQAIALALRGVDTEYSHEELRVLEYSQEALRVLDIILRQHAAKKGCLLVRQSFFHKSINFADIGGAIMACQGFHSSFRTTQGGLSLNIGATSTLIVKPGQVIDFLKDNQKVKNLHSLDWTKVKRILKNLRIKTFPTNQEFRITGLSDLPCNKQFFTLKENGVETEITVYDYFVKKWNLESKSSGDLPCINVGKQTKPTYFPLEFCELIPLQRYSKALSGLQRAKFVENSRQRPRERMSALSTALRTMEYGSNPMLQASDVSISTQFTPVVGHVLQAPKLRMGNREDFTPIKGRWDFREKKLIDPTDISNWVVVIFSAGVDGNVVQGFIKCVVEDLIKCARSMGIRIMTNPKYVIEEEDPRGSHLARVDAMFEKMVRKLPDRPKFALCILPEPKKPDIYGPWKRRCLFREGIITQCIAPKRIGNPPKRSVGIQYLANVLLKINAKLGGINSLLHDEYMGRIPHVSSAPTIIIGMDVSHSSPGQYNIPSIAAVVSSRCWPSISRYRAFVRTQSPHHEMVDSLFKPLETKTQGVYDDDGIIRELLLDFYRSSGGKKPQNIIIFRDGVSESQFNQVLNIELDQIIKACELLEDRNWSPKFTLLVAQKNHHTRFFTKDKYENVPAGTVVDTRICHPRNYDFYMCSHAGTIGTSRPTHYHVLLDEIGFAPNDLLTLVHSLSYVYQRSSTAISVVAPIYYADLAAGQIRVAMRFDEMTDVASTTTTDGAVVVPPLPNLHDDVRSSMFFC